MARAQMAAVAAVFILGLTGCSSSSAADSGANPSTSAGTHELGAAAGDDSQITPSVGKELPLDFPDDVPLPSAKPTTVSTGRVPGGKKLWSIGYAGDVARVAAEERAALQKAGYTVTLEAADGTGSYVKGMTSVVTAVRDGAFVIMVSTLA